MKKLMIVAVLPLAACATQDSPSVGTANPASEYCESIGGDSEMRQVDGGVTGYCRLPDGRMIDEWELFRSAQPED
ncbi:DUF333 domain-containing protein [Billgrantia endophytica]|uniref:DUF333 domain-containing protein n=1 Tax=Billgrantia endophytica TaxID=2033802 RepID=A0A2N7U015_9GAMM|nr:DUF333 domain-containing protein [Halomonas endophytica]PMR73753.1 DUF333 domain-containing protein [Halomonas endophytica]